MMQFGAPGAQYTQGNRLTRLMSGQDLERLNDGSIGGGLAYTLARGLQGYQDERDSRQAAAADRAFMQGLQSGGYAGAIQALQGLQGLQGNSHAQGRLTQLLMAQAGQQQQQAQQEAQWAREDERFGQRMAAQDQQWQQRFAAEQAARTEQAAADRAFRERMFGLEQAAENRGAFAGTSMDAQARNILLSADPSSPEYAAAYAYASQPRTIMRPDGVAYERPDLSWAPAPGGTMTAGRPSLTGSAAPLTGGTPQAAAGGGVRPFQAGEFVQNPDGTQSTERTVTIQTPTGEWVNVPSLWMGQAGPQQLNDNQIAGAMQAYEAQTGQSFPRFGSLQEAEAAARTRSMAGGAGQGPLPAGGMPQAPGMQQIGPNMLFAPFAGPEADRKRTAAAETERRTANIVTQDIDRALSLLDEGAALPMTGFVGNLTSNIGGTPQYDLNALLDTVRANIGFAALQEMRANSPTGGALGQVSEFENRLLQATQGNLAIGQTEEQLRRNLGRVREFYNEVLGGPVPTPQQVELALRKLEEGIASPGGQMGRTTEGAVPAGVDPQDWQYMTPEERALFQ